MTEHTITSALSYDFANCKKCGTVHTKLQMEKFARVRPQRACADLKCSARGTVVSRFRKFCRTCDGPTEPVGVYGCRKCAGLTFTPANPPNDIWKRPSVWWFALLRLLRVA